MATNTIVSLHPRIGHDNSICTHGKTRVKLKIFNILQSINHVNENVGVNFGVMVSTRDKLGHHITKYSPMARALCASCK